MTKKHFIALADYIKSENYYAEGVERTWGDYHIKALASFLRAQNPRFNRERWLGYISGANGPNGGKVKP